MLAGMGPGAREVFVVIALALACVVLAATVALGPWYPGRPAPGTPVVRLVTPGGVAGRR
jgi:hypothetical protein